MSVEHWGASQAGLSIAAVQHLPEGGGARGSMVGGSVLSSRANRSELAPELWYFIFFVPFRLGLFVACIRAPPALILPPVDACNDTRANQTGQTHPMQLVLASRCRRRRKGPAEKASLGSLVELER